MSTESRIARRRQAARTEGGAEYKARREELVKVAAEVFQEKGYQASTLNDIAERLGADRASLYYYVSSKEELFHDVVRGVLDANIDEAKRIVDLDEKPAEKLRRLIRCLLVSYEKNYPYTYVYIQEDMARVGQADSGWARGMSQQTRRFEAIVCDVLQEAVATRELRSDINLDLATNALFGMTNWTHRWFRPDHGIEAEEIAETFSFLCIEGMYAR